MLEYAGSQRAGLRNEREAPHLLSVARSLDWVLFVGVAALVLVGLWGVAGVTKFAGSRAAGSAKPITRIDIKYDLTSERHPRVWVELDTEPTGEPDAPYESYARHL